MRLIQKLFGIRELLGLMQMFGEDGLKQTLAALQVVFCVGFLWGGIPKASEATLRFLAEHHHIIPKLRTRQEVMYFERLRNARVLMSFCHGGMNRGMLLAALTAGYVGIRNGCLIVARPQCEKTTAIVVEELSVASGVFSAMGLARISHDLYNVVLRSIGNGRAINFKNQLGLLLASGIRQDLGKYAKVNLLGALTLASVRFLHSFNVDKNEMATMGGLSIKTTTS